MRNKHQLKVDLTEPEKVEDGKLENHNLCVAHLSEKNESVWKRKK